MRPAFATIHLGHLAHNYRLIQQKSGSSKVIAVVKANAYGHGLEPVATALLQEGCRSFAVTDADEGSRLRAALPKEIQPSCDILLLSGLFDDHDALLSQQYGLTPVLSEPEQLKRLLKVNFQGHIWVKVDTGMNRIGTSDLNSFLNSIKDSFISLAGIMSHLACADTPNHPLNQTQAKAFQEIRQSTKSPAYSLLNSAGIIALPEEAADFIRPGIALYGAEPIPAQPLGLKPVMQLSAHIMQLRHIKAGESVSYDASWVAKEPTCIAIVSLGYADGLPRSLSNQGKALHHTGHLPIVGKICMDYCMLAVNNSQVKIGDEVSFFGYNKDNLVLSLAEQCNTITYEVFTGISSRVTRRYVRGES